MKNNWILLQEEVWKTAPYEDDFDDYGYGEDHSVSIGDEIESSDKDGKVHAGVVVGIIRDLDRNAVCYKIWDSERDDFDYVQASDSVVCEPCGSSQWALKRIGYTRHDGPDGRWFYHNGQTGDVIYW